MNLKEYADYDGIGLAELVSKGDVSAQELARCALEAVEAVNLQINAVIEVYDDRAKTANELASPDQLFSGVPFFLKDIGAGEAGKKQELGSRIAEGYVVHEDAFLTQRFKSAGLVLLGRTTTPEFGLASTTETVLYGETRNPWNPQHVAGGSSGGAAAAVAAGIVPVAHASDGGGSIRIPASCCGLVGLKPSRGRNTLGPSFDEFLFGYVQEHVVSRTVRDTAAMLDYTSRPGIGDPFVIVQPDKRYVDEVNAPTGQLRIAFTTKSWLGEKAEREIAAAVEAVARQCGSMGHVVEEASPCVSYQPYESVGNRIWVAELSTLIDELGKKMGREPSLETLEPVTLDAYEMSKRMSASELVEAVGKLNPLRRQVGAFFEQYDLLITPTLAKLPPLLGTVHTNQDISFEEFRRLDQDVLPNLELFNVTGQPAISLPLAQSESGLPIGVQFVGRFGDESALIRISSALEEAMPWRERISPVHAARGQRA